MMKKIDYNQLSEVIKKVKVKDEEAFVELYELTCQRIYHLANSILHDEYLAQDVVQEVYMIVIDSIGNLENDQLFMAWIHKITYRHALSKLKKRKEIPSEMEGLKENAAALSEADVILEQAIKSERNQIVWDNIKKLSKEQQMVIIMKYYENMKIDEIAVVLDCPEGTIKSRLHMAKKLLKKYLRKHIYYFFEYACCCLPHKEGVFVLQIIHMKNIRPVRTCYFPPTARGGG